MKAAIFSSKFKTIRRSELQKSLDPNPHQFEVDPDRTNKDLNTDEKTGDLFLKEKVARNICQQIKLSNKSHCQLSNTKLISIVNGTINRGYRMLSNHKQNKQYRFKQPSFKQTCYLW
jgi:hypothetical protein